MWKVMRFLIIFLFFGYALSAERKPRELLYGLCHNVSTPLNFDLARWTDGPWYEIARYSNSFEDQAECVQQGFFVDAANPVVDIGFFLRFPNGTDGILQARANYTTTNEVEFDVVFPEDSQHSTFDILGTDYDNFAITYSCWQISLGSLPEKQERLWVLSRERTMSNDTLSIVNETLQYDDENLGRYLDEVPQINCS